MALLNRFSIALWLAFAMLVAGCTGAKLEPSAIDSAGTLVQTEYQNYTFLPPFASDGYANLLTDHPLLRNPAAAPYGVYQLLPRGGPEPTIGVTKKGSIFIATLDYVQRSMDQGKTWEVVWEYSSPNFPVTQDRFATFDPLMYVDPETDRIFITHLEILHPQVASFAWCMYLAYSDDDGKTWSDKVGYNDAQYRPGVNSCTVGFMDHQKIVTADVGPKTREDDRNLFTNYPDRWTNLLYNCYNKVDPTYSVFGPTGLQEESPSLGTWCEVSPDSGRSWPIATKIHDMRTGCSNVNGQPVAYPDGTIVVALAGFPEHTCGPFYPPTVVVSEDSGRTWTPRVMDNQDIGQTEIDPDITITPDGTAYILFRGKDQHSYLARSGDKFVTWEGPWRVSPPEHTLNVFATIVSGDNDRLAMAYLGTSDAQAKLATPSNATGGTHWHAFVSYSLDAASESPTFYTQQVSPVEDPVQVGCVWLRGGGSACRNLLDFIDMVRDEHGRYFVTLTDGCTPRNGCTIDTDAVNFQSRDGEAAALIQDRGISLFAEKGVLPAIGLQVPQPYSRG